MTAVAAASPARSFLQGLAAIAPLLVGVAPFGVIIGVTAVEGGLAPVEAVGLSTLVFAGAAQLAALELLAGGAVVWVAVMTALVINLRMALYSASLARHLADEPWPRRVVGAYLLSDQAFAVSVARFARHPVDVWRWWFYLGAALGLWATWQVATITGALAGDVIPDAVPLGLAVPLVFVSLLVPALTDRPSLAAAVSAGAVAVAAAPLPANLGMPSAALVGVGVGWAVSRRRARKARR